MNIFSHSSILFTSLYKYTCSLCILNTWNKSKKKLSQIKKRQFCSKLLKSDRGFRSHIYKIHNDKYVGNLEAGHRDWVMRMLNDLSCLFELIFFVDFVFVVGASQRWALHEAFNAYRQSLMVVHRLDFRGIWVGGSDIWTTWGLATDKSLSYYIVESMLRYSWYDWIARIYPLSMAPMVRLAKLDRADLIGLYSILL